MLFFPSIFDTPHKILPYGVYTFIMHPSFTGEAELKHFDSFINKYREYFKPVPEILDEISKYRKRNLFEKAIRPSITAVRKVRDIIK